MPDTLIKFKTGALSKLEGGATDEVSINEGTVYFATDSSDNTGKIWFDDSNGNRIDMTAYSQESEYAALANNVDGVVAVANGGTGASSAAAARTNLGITPENIGAYRNNEYGRGTLDIGIRPYINQARANRLAFLPANQIIIEKTIDGGITWEDAGISDTIKPYLFNEIGTNINLPLLNNARSEKCGLRITITGMKYNVPLNTAEISKYNYWNSEYVLDVERYFNVKEWWFWLSAKNDTIRPEIYCASGENSSIWTKVFDDNNFTMSGDTGSNWIKLNSNLTFGGAISQTSNKWNWRLIFWSHPWDNYNEFRGNTAQFITQIRCYGDSVWRTPNNLMKKDHLYTWDKDMNASFPAKLSAVSIDATKLSGTIPASCYTNTTYTFDGTYNASSNKAATVSTVTNAINALDGGTIGTGATSKTITALSQTNGNISATFNDISITKSQISDFPTIPAAVSVKGNAESSYRTGEVNLTPANLGISATTSSVTVGSTTFEKYSHPTTTATNAAAVKVGKDNLGHVVLGSALTASDVGAATSGHNHDDTYLKKSGGTLTGALTLNADPTANLEAATKQYVDNAFAVNDAMVFKGVLNSSSGIPDTHQAGWTYRIGATGTYAGNICEVGDLLICVADGTTASDNDWVSIQNNIDGALFKGTNTFTDEQVLAADGVTGKVKTTGYTIAKSVPSNAVFTDTVQIFWVTYNSTTASQISSAISANKIPILKYSTSDEIVYAPLTNKYEDPMEWTTVYVFTAKTNTVNFRQYVLNGSTWSNSSNKLLTTSSQTLSSTEKTQVRTNIGAIASSDLATVATSGSYEDLTNKPTEVIVDNAVKLSYNSTTESLDFIFI